MSSTAQIIELASTLAQQEMNELDAEALQELLELYEAAADLIADSTKKAALDGNAVRIEQLGELRAQVEQHLAWLNAQRQALLNEKLPRAAELGARPFSAALDLNTQQRINHDAVRFVREFQAADGLQLSDRIWRINRAAREKLINEIELAVVQGHTANQAARAMLARGENPDVIGLDAASPDKIARASREILTGEGGSAYYNAARVFRTELNRAHGTAYQRGAELTPGCIGTRFLLSPAHPKHDICDTHATADLYGLGKGVYPHGKNPWPAHPGTLSYVVAVFDETAMGTNATMPTMDNRDDITKRYFNGNVSIDNQLGEDYELNGHILSDADYIALAGAPDGSAITVQLDAGGISITAENPMFSMPSVRVIYEDFEGPEFYLDQTLFGLQQEMQGQGIASRSVAMMVEAARERGFTAITTYGEKGDNSVGYLVWPRLGFDGDLTDFHKQSLPTNLQGAETILDLMESEEGRRWWAINGTPVALRFDLTSGSKSTRMLNNYLIEQGVIL